MLEVGDVSWIMVLGEECLGKSFGPSSCRRWCTEHVTLQGFELRNNIYLMWLEEVWYYYVYIVH